MGYLGQKYDKGIVIQRSPEGSAFQEDREVTVDGDAEITPNVSGGMKKVTVHGGGGGSEVIANPELEGDEDLLEGIEIDGVKYKIPEGGAGAEGIIDNTILFNALEYNSNFDIFTNKDIENFDDLIDIVGENYFYPLNIVTNENTGTSLSLLTRVDDWDTYMVDETITGVWFNLMTPYGQIHVEAQEVEGEIEYPASWHGYHRTPLELYIEAEYNLEDYIDVGWISTFDNYQQYENLISQQDTFDNVWIGVYPSSDSEDYLTFYGELRLQNNQIICVTSNGYFSIEVSEDQKTGAIVFGDVHWDNFTLPGGSLTTSSLNAYYINGGLRKAIPVAKYQVKFEGSDEIIATYNTDKFYTLAQQAYKVMLNDGITYGTPFNMPTYFTEKAAQPIELRSVRDALEADGIYFSDIEDIELDIITNFEPEDPITPITSTFTGDNNSNYEGYIRITNFGSYNPFEIDGIIVTIILTPGE